MEYYSTNVPERFTVKYYIFGEDGADLMLYVDQNTYKVYCFWSNGFFSTFDEDSKDFTFDMAFMRIEYIL